MTTTIADTSCLVFSHIIDPELLRRLYGQVLVPEAVLGEVEVGRRRGDPGPDILATPWLEVRPTALDPRVLALPKRLGAGEAAVLSLALAVQPQPAYALIDERRASRAAELLQVPSTGVLGVVAAAKEAGIIVAAGPQFARLVDAGFWVTPELIRRVLARLGEV